MASADVAPQLAHEWNKAMIRFTVFGFQKGV